MGDSTIKEWLERLGADYVEESVSDEATWHLRVKSGDWNTHIVGEAKEEAFQLQRGIALSDEHKEKLKALSAAEERDFRFKLVRDLIHSGLDFELSRNSDGRLEALRLMDRRFLDAETIRSFNEALRRIHSTGILAVMRVRYLAGDEI